MGKYVNRITYKGREILFMNVANMEEKECMEAWEEGKQELLKEQKACLALVDVTHTHVSVALVNKAREGATSLKKNPANRVVFVGMSSLQKSTAQLHTRTVGIRAHFCSTLEEGKEWLVKEDDQRR
jgi:hypothetical protein